MPVATARRADIGTADPQPVVLGRRRQHGGQQLTVGGLDGGALGERGARLGGADGESVPQLLQLAEVEHPRGPGGADPVRDDDPAQPFGDEACQLQLELADLAAQLGARKSLIDLDSFEHSAHKRILSRFGSSFRKNWFRALREGHRDIPPPEAVAQLDWAQGLEPAPVASFGGISRWPFDRPRPFQLQEGARRSSRTPGARLEGGGVPLRMKLRAKARTLAAAPAARRLQAEGHTAARLAIPDS
jgi:hypothetical protein